MKHIIITLFSLLLCGNAFANLPKWMIFPNYDQLSVKVDGCLLQTDSLGVSSLWTMDGKRLFTTNHYIHPYKDGVAVITKKGSSDLIGIVDTLGNFTALPNIKVACDHPYFEDGYLLCQESDNYSYYKKDGTKAVFTKASQAYPFHGGFAPFFIVEDKGKDPYYGYYRANGDGMRYRMLKKGEEKEVDNKDIIFLSGIGYNNRGIAIIKNKFYIFNPDTQIFEAFLYGDDDSEKKRHLALYNDKYFSILPNDTIRIIAKYGKNQLAELQFDKELRPVRFIFEGEEQTFSRPESKEFKYSSELKSYGEKGSYGLTYESQKILPQQFDEVGLLYRNKAFVKTDSKWGVIEIRPDLSYQLKLNKGGDVAFRHQIFDTQLRLDLPADISAKDARIDIPLSSGCILDKTSRETKDTESGNYVIYNCSLTIPEALPDTMTTITYSPVSISYNDIHLFETPIKIKAWHLKYYNVDPIESETSISNGIASFTININAQKNVGESDYPFDVKIEADSISVEYEKISETRYKCLVSNLQEGNNNINIIVTEKGCPPSVFPFEIYYTKPVPKKRKEESVVVRKKSPKITQPASRIEL